MAEPPVAVSNPPTTNDALVAAVSPVADAVNCFAGPGVLHSIVLPLIVPFPAAAPISYTVVPRSDPEPAVKEIVTGNVEGKPTEVKLPNASCDLTTG